MYIAACASIGNLWTGAAVGGAVYGSSKFGGRPRRRGIELRTDRVIGRVSGSEVSTLMPSILFECRCLGG